MEFSQERTTGNVQCVICVISYPLHLKSFEIFKIGDSIVAIT